MSILREEIAAYEEMRSNLEAAHLGKWALVHDSVLVDVFEEFDQAASIAVRRFGRGPYLIRQIGARTVSLPASVMYGPLNGAKQQRLR